MNKTKTKTLTAISLAVSALVALGAAIPGTIVTSKITTGNTVNTNYAIGDTSEMAGTEKQAANAAARLAIPAARRTEGMTCWQSDTGEVWRLVGGINNTNWLKQDITLPSNLVTNGQVGLKLVGAQLYGASTNSLGLIVTNLMVTGIAPEYWIPYYTNGPILYWPLDVDTNGSRKGIIIKGPLGDYEQLYWPNHGDGGPEMVTTINGRLAWYFTGWQMGNPSGQSGSEFIWNVPGRSAYIKNGVTNYALCEAQNIQFFEAPVWTSSVPIPSITITNWPYDVVPLITTNQNWLGPVTYGAGWTRAGSLDFDGMPATHFRATSTNGSGAWVWYDRFTMPLTGTWPNNTLNYNDAIERFRITVGPDGGATLVGTMNATAFSGSNMTLSGTLTAAEVIVNGTNSTTTVSNLNVTGSLTFSSLVISTNAAPATNTIVGFFWVTNGANIYKIPLLQ